LAAEVEAAERVAVAEVEMVAVVEVATSSA
jgi:hypothetical protein